MASNLDSLDFNDSEIILDAADLAKPPEQVEPPCQFITGSAGCGKTHQIREQIKADPDFGVLCASTGIAAVNLGTTTINSLLGYYDTASLQDAYIHGSLTGKLRKISQSGVRHIILDEASMTPNAQLDIIYNAIREVNAYSSVKSPLGLILVGDVMQLPPVVEKEDRVKVPKGQIAPNPYWMFKALCWPNFAANTQRLTKQWRQSDPEFLAAINHLRAGQGRQATDLLKTMVRFEPNLMNNFDGTTIMGTNLEVDRFNQVRLQQLRGQPFRIASERWGKVAGDWKNIPERADLKIGAYVMLLNNCARPFDEGGGFLYVNGETGHIVGQDTNTITVKLVRNGEEVPIHRIHRTMTSRSAPDSPESEWATLYPGETPQFGRVSRVANKDIWHIGGVRFFPVRLAFAATVHKTQGLTLDRIQVDVRHQFMGSPAMLYTAISRVKTPGGLRIVGSEAKLIENCRTDPEVIPWL